MLDQIPIDKITPKFYSFLSVFEPLLGMSVAARYVGKAETSLGGRLQIPSLIHWKEAEQQLCRLVSHGIEFLVMYPCNLGCEPRERIDQIQPISIQIAVGGNPPELHALDRRCERFAHLADPVRSGGESVKFWRIAADRDLDRYGLD